MTRIAYLVFVLAGCIPLLRAWQANRHTTLRHALAWAGAAWLTWGLALTAAAPTRAGLDPWRYIALSLTAASGIAVLGARRPQVGAWNFVVVGLVAVMLLPLVESTFIGTHPYDSLRIAFLSGTLAVGCCNYLPTRFWPAALQLLVAGALEIGFLYGLDVWPLPALGDWLLLLTPWNAWLCALRKQKETEGLQRLWLKLRDRYGVFWGQRVRDQFNQAARHAQVHLELRWRDTVASAASDEDRRRALQILRAVVERFMDVE